MTTLLLRLVGPMQSWGTTSRFEHRDTQLEPSKSGVLGIAAAALGRDRSEDISDLAALRMGVRVDKEGILKRDYHTAQRVISSDGKHIHKTGLSERYYLADAAFLVGLSGDGLLLEEIQHALKNPHWVLALGRKAFTPSQPIHLPDGLVEKGLESALTHYPPIHEAAKQLAQLRYALEDDQGSQLRQDQPIDTFASRRFIQRRIHITMRDNPFFTLDEQVA